MKKEVLFIGGTHGDEAIGVVALKQLSDMRDDFDWVIGNPRALQQNTRYTENDLNRSAPGDLSSSLWEKRRAAEIIQRSKEYQITIDIHGTKSDFDICTLITNPTPKNIVLASLLNIQNIVLWPSITPEMKYPMSEFFPCGLEIECGRKMEIKTTENLVTVLNDFLERRITKEKINSAEWQINTLDKNFYEMIGSLNKSEIPPNTPLKEFEEINLNGEIIAPIFIGTYTYPEILAYKLKKLSPDDLEKYF